MYFLLLLILFDLGFFVIYSYDHISSASEKFDSTSHFWGQVAYIKTLNKNHTKKLPKTQPKDKKIQNTSKNF